MDLTLAIPHDSKCWAGYGLAAVLGLWGVSIIWRNRRAKRGPHPHDKAKHLQALARYHAKMHEGDDRKF